MKGIAITDSALDEPGVPELIEAHLALMRVASPRANGFSAFFTKALVPVGVSR